MDFWLITVTVTTVVASGHWAKNLWASAHQIFMAPLCGGDLEPHFADEETEAHKGRGVTLGRTTQLAGVGGSRDGGPIPVSLQGSARSGHRSASLGVSS